MGTVPIFDPDCRRCPRLADYLDRSRQEYPGYHSRPVAPFGDPNARCLIVGLAPGLHGANASGRPFTGDHAGILLYQTLYDFGLSTAPVSKNARDRLRLKNCRITNAVKCVPPQNKPMTDEIRNCNGFLRAELDTLPRNGVILALGAIAHNAVLRALELKLSGYRFSHGAEFSLDGGLTMIDSYHCSRYNTQTRRLTPSMFRDIFRRIAARIGMPSRSS